jgi:hypothetical protein
MGKSVGLSKTDTKYCQLVLVCPNRHLLKGVGLKTITFKKVSVFFKKTITFKKVSVFLKTITF